MRRVRARLPWQLAEQGVASDHSLKTQSWSLLQSVDSQPSYSVAGPAAGFPHHVSFTLSFRPRILVPWPQVAEQEPHSSHVSHSPSMQHSGCPLQLTTGLISSLTLGAQRCPPPLGIVSISRLRFLKPTPHMSGAGTQSDQLSHWAHLQSTEVLHGSSLQCLASSSPPSQPWAPSGAGWEMLRVRVMYPSPQEMEQWLHSLHPENLQTVGSASGHGASPQGASSSKGPSHCRPCPLAWASMLRERACCAPPHVFGQVVHMLQVEKMQFWCTDVSTSHGRVSYSLPSHGRPPASASRIRIRFRLDCCPPGPSHLLHNDHGPSWQSPGSRSSGLPLQELAPQGRTSARLASQAAPPFRAAAATVRLRACWPPPQLLSQSPQALQAETWQSSGALAPVTHEPVMLRGPMQPVPSKAGSTRILRKWNFWSSSEAHWVHCDHGASLQSWLSQLASHALVVLRAPVHGLPQSLFGVTIVRLRSQMPSHWGSLHSDHGLSTQSCGTHSSSHGGMSLQS
mmetsp:Transcript_106573/g.311533  ORF Transcript_106573/g.311533 Transcript_106573/m.311533 type:complete len:511 (-) Transcript_106573:2510-4042(-)